MLKMLRLWLHPASAQMDGPYRSRSLPLPAGTIVAEQGLQHLLDAPGGRAVTALLDEAYVVMQLLDRGRWYAAWQPYLGRWDRLHLVAEDAAAVAAAEPLSALPGRATALAH